MEKKMTEFDIDCRICHTKYTVSANEVDVCNWQDGVLIQEAMPYLSADDRELFISGTCDDCWTDMYGVCEVEDDYYDSGIDF